MSLGLFGYTPEEYVNFKISIGLISQNERQNEINKLYKDASEILNEMLNGNDKNIMMLGSKPSFKKFCRDSAQNIKRFQLVSNDITLIFCAVLIRKNCK